MGTRGAIGFRINGQDKITYNHFDSYPDALGENVLKFIGSTLFADQRAKLKPMVEGLRMVNEDDPPTAADAGACAKFTDTTVGNQSVTDWYCLLRGAQGELAAYLEAGVMPDSAGFLKDSLFCEYAYIINLDGDLFEFYMGFNKDPKAKGRYAAERGTDPDGQPSEYFGVALVKAWPLDKVRGTLAAQGGLEKLVKEMNRLSKTEE